MTNMDKLTDYLLNTLHTVGDAIPKATEYALQVTSMGCQFNLITDAIGVAVGLMILLLTGITYKIYNQKIAKWWKTYDKEILAVLCAGTLLLSAMTGSAIIFNSLSDLLDFWAWTCINHPDLYLVHQLLSKI